MQFRSDWSAIWVYNPRNGILMQHGFEESGDVQDIRLVVDTIPTLAWSARPDGSDPEGMTYKMVIDATTPKAPETHGHYSQELRDPAGTQQWMKQIGEMMASAAKQGGSR